MIRFYWEFEREWRVKSWKDETTGNNISPNVKFVVTLRSFPDGPIVKMSEVCGCGMLLACAGKLQWDHKWYDQNSALDSSSEQVDLVYWR